MLINFLDGTEREVELTPGANLSEANLSEANLRGANLLGANLRGAYLSEANLRGANLRGADLGEAYLRGADLSEANLREANLGEAYLYGANLSEANLRGANLRGADLREANLQDAKHLAAFTVAPPHGPIIGYKKVGSAIITLHIPADAKRVNAYGSRKCRAEFAYVLAGGGGAEAAHGGFRYPMTGLVTPDSYDPDPRVECSHGIHFFITEEEARDYC